MQKLVIYDEVFELMKTDSFKENFFQAFDLMDPQNVEKQIHFNDFLNAVTSLVDFKDLIKIKKDSKEKKYAKVRFADEEVSTYIREKRLDNYKLKELYYDVCIVLNACQEKIKTNKNFYEDLLTEEKKGSKPHLSEKASKNHNLLTQIKPKELKDLNLTTDYQNDLINSLLNG
ncbi:MAG: hypothetical protein ACQEQG_00360 [Bacillota bacterium]